ncbi:DoxX family protein [Rhodococcus opacus]|uniref:DoxX family protein n=1 Tax=Rhodococcus opacus TaxID=37919 RepID=A0AAX3YT72_RHOOP|nr:DoxX family protein [Rhodococcus opacus]MCZ4590625.1 DoxX family protein [Rhodococcus opacus]WLF52677.1 DoxX family protein [Rhodococcus opacus]
MLVESDRVRQKRGFGGVDVAELLLRTTIGATMVAHGVKHARSLDGTTRWFESIGFRDPKFQAATSAGVEILSGSALIAGSMTPVAAAAVIGTMGVAIRTVHAPNGFFITAEGYEYAAGLAAGCVALVSLPAGMLSLDRHLRLGRFRGVKAALATLIAGATAAASHTSVFWNSPRRPTRDAQPPTPDLTTVEPDDQVG